MQTITWDLIGVMAFGIVLFLIVGVQLRIGKVYTRGGRGVKWHARPVVSRQEAPVQFWAIITAQGVVGLICVVASGVEIVYRLTP